MDLKLDTKNIIDMGVDSISGIHVIEEYNDNETNDIIHVDDDNGSDSYVSQDETCTVEPITSECNDEVPQKGKQCRLTPVMKIVTRTERQIAQIYTPTIFKNFFQPELMKVTDLTCDVQKDDEIICTLSLKEYGACHPANTIVFNNNEEKVTCGCHLYERMGILCSHIFRVFVLKIIIELCQDNIMKRWTKDVTKGVARDGFGIQVRANREDAYSMRYNDLFQRCNMLLANGAVSPNAYEYTKMIIDEACDKVATRVDKENASTKQVSPTPGSLTSLGTPALCVNPILSVASNPHMTIKAPTCAKPKEQLPTHLRIKPQYEERTSKRKCGGCGVVGHDRLYCARYDQSYFIVVSLGFQS
ncbi:hypothetical protein AMTRI_Chr01g108940 [Amborella trichopoda]